MNPTIDVGQWFFVFAIFCGCGFLVMLFDLWLGGVFSYHLRRKIEKWMGWGNER